MLDYELLSNAQHDSLLRLAAHLNVVVPQKLQFTDTDETHHQLVKRVMKRLRKVGALDLALDLSDLTAIREVRITGAAKARALFHFCYIFMTRGTFFPR